MRTNIFRLHYFALCLLAIATTFCITATPAHAITNWPVATDGSVGINTEWEDGTSTSWYIEMQRVGADYISEGISLENDSEIRFGINIINWGFNHQASDGSFAGTSDAFHSTSLFIESAARADLQLQSYNPTMYQKNTSYYASTLSAWKTELEAAALWETEPAIAAAGQLTNAPYGHRRWLLAAALSESSAVTGDANLLAEAYPYAQQGIAEQLPAGWTAAIMPPNSAGVYPDSPLLAPGQSPPAGTLRVIVAQGVNPELNGYDVSYQGVGLLMECRYLAYCTNSTMRKEILADLRAGYGWEHHWIDQYGTVTWEGSTRVDKESNRDGEIKGIDYESLEDGLYLVSTIQGNSYYQTIGNRVVDQNSPVESVAPLADGSVGTNATAEQNKSTAYDISQQALGLKYITVGISREDDSIIRTGILVFNNGFNKEASNGTFPGSPYSYWNAINFAQAAATASLLLTDYSPETYTLNAAYYSSTIAAFNAKLTLVAAWMTGSLAPKIVAQYATSPSEQYGGAAFLAEIQALNPKLNYVNAAEAYAKSALAMQLTNGENPESGSANPNDQSFGLIYAEQYYNEISDSALQNKLSSMIANGLNWESQFINLLGQVTTVPDAATGHYQQAFQDGYQVTDENNFIVIYNRLCSPYSGTTAPAW